MRKSLTLLALCVLLFSAGCTGGAFPGGGGAPTGFLEEPTRAHIVAMAALLPPQQARELLAHFNEHPKVWGLEKHVKDTCPFITYWPAYLRHQSGETSDLEWAEFLHEFFEDKHKEEGDCDCDELLGRAGPVTEPKAESKAEPKAQPPTAVKPDRGSEDKDDDDKEDAIKEIINDWLKKKAAELDVKPK